MQPISTAEFSTECRVVFHCPLLAASPDFDAIACGNLNWLSDIHCMKVYATTDSVACAFIELSGG